MTLQPAATARTARPVNTSRDMRPILALVMLAMVAALSIGCAKFTAEVTTNTVAGAAPLNVTFTNDGSEAESQTWNFGDGSEPHEAGAATSVDHTYTKAGTFTVTLNSVKGDKVATSTITVTVSPGPLTQINLDSWPGEVEVATSVSVNTVAVDDFGNPVQGASVSYEVPADAGAIDASGVFQASTASGEFPDGLAVTAVLGDRTVNATADLNVIPAALDHVEVEPAELEVTPTEAVQITVRALDVHGNEITDADVSITSESAVGTVTPQGEFTAARAVAQADEGITVTVTDGDLTEEVTLAVNVIPGALDSVEITPGSYEAEVASSQKFTATALDEFGNEIPDLDIMWSAAPAAGLINSSGSFAAGTESGTFASSITATAAQDDVEVESSIDVTLLPGAFSQVVVTTAQVEAGEETQLAASAADEYGNAIEGATLTWELLDSALGSLSDTGTLTPSTRARVYAQSIKVEATKDGQTESVTVDLTVAPGALSQVAMLPGEINLGMGIEQQYVAVAGDRFGNPIPEATLAWSVDADAGAIDENGLFVAGNTPGSYTGAVTVTATYDGNEATKSSTVEVEPDRIMFYSERNSDAGQFFLMNTDGSDQSALTFGEFAFGPASWSPDGRRVAFDIFASDGGVLITDESGTYTWLVAPSASLTAYSSPSWSPDGRQLVVLYWDFLASTTELMLIDIDGGNITQLTDTPTFYETYPTWSPDGQYVVYRQSEPNGPGDIYRINVNTKQKQRLTNNPADDADPAYSPDGSKILFSTARDGNFELYVMDADGKNQTKLTQSPDQDFEGMWSPDGTQIVFASDRDGDFEIYTMNADGTDVTKLTSNSDFENVPTWAPRKAGITVNADAVILPSEDPSDEQTVQSLTAGVRASVVRIVTDLGSGSGFVIHEDGLILTNNHVVVDASEITVTLDDGTEYEATVVGRDLTHDLAVIRIDATGLQALEFGVMTQGGLGSEVLVLGYPLGSSDLNVTTGVVSAVKVDDGRGSGWVQTDAAVNHGNSGGPMLNMQGQVVGIVSAGLFGSSVENVGLAVDSTTILTYLDRLIAGETVVIN